MSSEISKFRQGKRTFQAPTEPGKKDTFEQRMFLTDDARKLDDQRTALVQEKFDLQFAKQGNMLILRKMDAADQTRLAEIDAELDTLTAKTFCERITAWPFVDEGKAVPLTPETVKQYFPGNDGAEYLNNVLAWAAHERFPKPETANN